MKAAIYKTHGSTEVIQIIDTENHCQNLRKCR